jgi:hypothetical protein
VPPDGIITFVRIGLEHVLSGLDHKALLLALLLLLLLLAGRPWSAALAATGFTIKLTAALVLAERQPDRARRAIVAISAAAAIVMLPVFAWLDRRSAPPWLVYAGAAVCAARLRLANPSHRIIRTRPA